MILIAGPSLKTCIEMALEAVCEKDGRGRRIFLLIYISSACAIIPQPSTLFLLLAFAFISSHGLTQTWLFPCIPPLFSYSTVSCVFSSVFFHLFSPPTFSLSSCLIICSHFTIHLPFPLLNSNIFVYVYRSIHVFWSSHFSQISFLSDVLWSVLFYLIITFAKIPLVNFPLFPFLTAFSCCLSIVLLFLGTILLISFTISFLPFLLLFL